MDLEFFVIARAPLRHVLAHNALVPFAPNCFLENIGPAVSLRNYKPTPVMIDISNRMSASASSCTNQTLYYSNNGLDELEFLARKFLCIGHMCSEETLHQCPPIEELLSM